MKTARTPLVLVHPPALSRRYLPTKFPPHGMATLYAGCVARGLPVVQVDRLMDSIYADPDGLDVFTTDRDLDEDGFRRFLDTGQGSARLTAFVERHLAALPADCGFFAFSVVSYLQYFAALLLGSALKRRDPGAVVILGGPCVTVKTADELAGLPVPNAWIRGCGLAPLPGLWANPGDNAAPGLLRLVENGILERPLSRSAAEEEPAPDFSGLDMASYRYAHPDFGPTVFLPFRMTKGCASHCAFCTGRLVDPFSAKTPQKIVRELEQLVTRYGVRTVMFTDAAVNANAGQFLATCRLLAERLPGLRWYGYARIKGFDAAQARAAAAAGCFALFFGVESAHPPTVRWLGKGFSAAELSGALDAAIQAGIRGVVHLMYNTPHEGPDDVAALLELSAHCADEPLLECMAQRFLLEPGSSLALNPERYGLCNLRLRPKGFFDRPEYLYDLADGTDAGTLAERHARNRELLAPALERMHRRSLPRDAAGRPILRESM